MDLGLTFGKSALWFGHQDEYYVTRLKTQFKYGQRETLLEFLGLGRNHIFMGEFQHGVLENGLNVTNPPYSYFFPPRGKWGKRLPWIVYNEKTAMRVRKNRTTAISIGAPYLYASQNISVGSELPSPKTLVMPRHLTMLSHYSELSHYAASEFSIRERIARWRKIANNDIAVCLYWLDFIDEKWQKIAEEESVKLLCAGLSETYPHWGAHKLRINFLSRLCEILRGFKEVIFDDVSSAIFFSLYEKKRIYIEPWSKKVLMDQNHSENGYWRALDYWFPDSLNRWISPLEFQHKNDQILGVDSLRTRDELGRLLPIVSLELLERVLPLESLG